MREVKASHIDAENASELTPACPFVKDIANRAIDHLRWAVVVMTYDVLGKAGRVCVVSLGISDDQVFQDKQGYPVLKIEQSSLKFCDYGKQYYYDREGAIQDICKRIWPLDDKYARSILDNGYKKTDIEEGVVIEIAPKEVRLSDNGDALYISLIDLMKLNNNNIG